MKLCDVCLGSEGIEVVEIQDELRDRGVDGQREYRRGVESKRDLCAGCLAAVVARGTWATLVDKIQIGANRREALDRSDDARGTGDCWSAGLPRDCSAS